MRRQLVAGLLHPWIHLGFGIEFEVAGVVAEGLAECAVHADEYAEYLGAVEEAVARDEKERKEGREEKGGESVGLMQLYEEIRGNESLMGATGYAERLGAGRTVMRKAMGHVVDVARRYVVKEGEVEERIREAVNVNGVFSPPLSSLCFLDCIIVSVDRTNTPSLPHSHSSASTSQT